MTDIPKDRALGKRLGVVDDPRTFRLRDFQVTRTLPRAPESSVLSRGQDFPMFLNDRIGDCTVVGRAHQIIAHERNARQREVPITDDDVLRAYSRTTGYVPDRPETDRGGYMLDRLNADRHEGIGREEDGTPHTLYAYVKVNHADSAEVRVATWLFGGLYVGAWLPLSAADQRTRWEVPNGGPQGDGEPGSWGGHAFYVNGYGRGAAGLSLVTWSEQITMSWGFWRTYVDEAYAVISEDWIRRSGRTTHGFDMERLHGFVNELRG